MKNNEEWQAAIKGNLAKSTKDFREPDGGKVICQDGSKYYFPAWMLPPVDQPEPEAKPDTDAWKKADESTRRKGVASLFRVGQRWNRAKYDSQLTERGPTDANVRLGYAVESPSSDGVGTEGTGGKENDEN